MYNSRTKTAIIIMVAVIAMLGIALGQTLIKTLSEAADEVFKAVLDSFWQKKDSNAVDSNAVLFLLHKNLNLINTLALEQLL